MFEVLEFRAVLKKMESLAHLKVSIRFNLSIEGQTSEENCTSHPNKES